MKAGTAAIFNDPSGSSPSSTPQTPGAAAEGINCFLPTPTTFPFLFPLAAPVVLVAPVVRPAASLDALEPVHPHPA